MRNRNRNLTGVPVGILKCRLARKKLEWCGYQMVERFDDILAISTEYRRVTDKRRDRQTSCDNVVRAMHSIAR